ncbi:hypothetical protein CC86DRAFT_446623 [Ophiobolus disseminans]|uniref:mRNA N(6)-methyladenine demethylase n=1 Tax=Ophiobolus disseminans TaxID=1469910 RepID=A0A6A6ZWX1_9PLEO|nr:hypothetical protein CC86DRAFT_446623 [Ophiobolus disseminans]
MQHLDPHQRPPDGIRHVYKKYQKMKATDLDGDEVIVDLSDGATLPDKTRKCHPMSMSMSMRTCQVGLHILPSLLPPQTQTTLLSCLLHRDLSNPAHLTNIHTHYNLTYPPQHTPSFFSTSPSSCTPIANPLDPAIHNALTISQLLNKKLRWTTLGGQYNWTAKSYPSSPPPPFPSDIKALLESIFADTKAEAAILNIYSPGDTLSVHRDVAESCSTGLVSVSLGCDAIFVIGTSDDKILALRLKSGGAVYMSGESRFAWHGVPRIVGGTSPGFLEDWPAVGGEFEDWRGWMGGKRVNLNVRQMGE